MKIYIDVCCFNRPFDKQNQARIIFETEAILKILDNCENNIWLLIWSAAISQEIELTPDHDRKKKMLGFKQNAKEEIEINSSIKNRAVDLEKLGFDFLDATHIAFAEYAEANIFLTTDDKLLKKYATNKNKVNVPIENPAAWILKGE